MIPSSYQVKIDPHSEDLVSSPNSTPSSAINSQMRRIDLICKLLGPFLIGFVDGISTELAILVNLGMNLFSILPEYLLIAQVCHSFPVYTEQSDI